MAQSRAKWIWDKSQDSKLAFKRSSHKRDVNFTAPKGIPSLSVCISEYKSQEEFGPQKFWVVLIICHNVTQKYMQFRYLLHLLNKSLSYNLKIQGKFYKWKIIPNPTYMLLPTPTIAKVHLLLTATWLRGPVACRTCEAGDPLDSGGKS